jgi:hypothetical protein
MAATTRKHKSACPSAKSKKAKAAKAKGANNRVAKADAKAGALEGGGVDTPFSPANNAGPPTVSAIRVDDATTLTTVATATKGGDKDKDANAVVTMRMTTTSVIDKSAPLPTRGGGTMMPLSLLTRPYTLMRGRPGRRGRKLQGRTGRGGHCLCRQQ